MNQTELDGEAAKPSGWTFRRALPILVLVLATAGAFWLGLHKHLSLDEISNNREVLRDFVTRHHWYAVLLYIGLYALAAALSLPGGLVLTILGGFLFGWLTGGAAAVIGATLGATGVFLIARTSLGGLLREKAGGALQRLADGFRKDAASYLLFLRLVPLFPFWLVNLAPALFGVPLGTYVLTTFVGIMPATFAFATAGAGLDSAITAQRGVYEACLARGGGDTCSMSIDPMAILTPQVMAALAALGLVALIPVLAKRFWRKDA